MKPDLQPEYFYSTHKEYGKKLDEATRDIFVSYDAIYSAKEAKVAESIMVERQLHMRRTYALHYIAFEPYYENLQAAKVHYEKHQGYYQEQAFKDASAAGYIIELARNTQSRIPG